MGTDSKARLRSWGRDPEKEAAEQNVARRDAELRKLLQEWDWARE